MSAFTADDARRLAALAQLELEPEEIEAFARQLRDILAFARQVQGVDTSPVASAGACILTPGAPCRDDTVTASLPRDEVLSAAPDGDPATGLFKVPRVFSE